jgi:HEAT repeat protein
MRTSKSEIPELLDLTHSTDIRSRRRALMALCPCELKSHSAEVWQRVLEMADDPDPSVRRSVIHTVADGSPAQYGPKIVQALEKLYNDSDRSVRRMARHVLTRYRHTGNLNTL